MIDLLGCTWSAREIGRRKTGASSVWADAFIKMDPRTSTPRLSSSTIDMLKRISIGFAGWFERPHQQSLKRDVSHVEMLALPSLMRIHSFEYLSL
jgi:hypothetical protein